MEFKVLDLLPDLIPEYMGVELHGVRLVRSTPTGPPHGTGVCHDTGFQEFY